MREGGGQTHSVELADDNLLLLAPPADPELEDELLWQLSRHVRRLQGVSAWCRAAGGGGARRGDRLGGELALCSGGGHLSVEALHRERASERECSEGGQECHPLRDSGETGRCQRTD